jgi:predicted ATPase
LMNILRRDVQGALNSAQKIIPFSQGKGFQLWTAVGAFKQGWAVAQQGEVEEGIKLLNMSLEGYKVAGMAFTRIELYVCLAESYGKAGQIDQGLKMLEEASIAVELSEERYFESELYRIKGELLLKKNSTTEAEKCFYKAIEIARSQNAKSWHLRAAISLSQLWLKQGKGREAKKLLQEIYDSFTEGFHTPELKEAKRILKK